MAKPGLKIDKLFIRNGISSIIDQRGVNSFFGQVGISVRKACFLHIHYLEVNENDSG